MFCLPYGHLNFPDFSMCFTVSSPLSECHNRKDLSRSYLTSPPRFQTKHTSISIKEHFAYRVFLLKQICRRRWQRWCPDVFATVLFTSWFHIMLNISCILIPSFIDIKSVRDVCWNWLHVEQPCQEMSPPPDADEFEITDNRWLHSEKTWNHLPSYSSTEWGAECLCSIRCGPPRHYPEDFKPATVQPQSRGGFLSL